VTTKQELREHIELINENRRLLIKDLQENEKSRSMHANLNRGVASELGLECGADWSKLPELVKALKAERDSLKKDEKTHILELKQTEEKLDNLAEICVKITHALGLNFRHTEWSELPRKAEVMNARLTAYTQQLVKLTSWRKATVSLPPEDEEYAWSSINVLLIAPTSAIPVVAYYHFEDKCWYDYHTGNFIYVNDKSEWLPLPVK